MLNSVDVIDVLDPMPRLVPVGDAAGRFVQWRDGAVHLLDDRLSEIARRDLPLADDVCVLAASSLDRLVLDFAGGLAIAGDEVITVPGLRADAAAFLGHLLVVAVPDGQRHRLLALDPERGPPDEQHVDAPMSSGRDPHSSGRTRARGHRRTRAR
ncbi:hypothetical protein GS889_21655 [Rhodococcus hoagii]|nr:hypothetical protein [Prescottella equi]